MSIEMNVKALMVDPFSKNPIIILKDPKGETVLPIWIGLFEAGAIASQLEKVPSPRPMTHDLLKSFLGHLEAKVTKIVITELKENTFYSLIHLTQGDRSITVDSRPSDAIALALRVHAPIFVEEEVITRARKGDMVGEAGDSDKLRQWLEKLDPEDLGKYEM